MIYGILIGAMLFKQFITATTVPIMLAGLPVSRWVIMLGIVVMYLFLGALMDAMAMVLLTLPIFFPLVTGLGFDPIWYGIILVRLTEIGAITPPIGINVYVVAGLVPDVPMPTIFRGIMPFLVADVLNVALLMLVPGIVMFLPNLL